MRMSLRIGIAGLAACAAAFAQAAPQGAPLDAPRDAQQSAVQSALLVEDYARADVLTRERMTFSARDFGDASPAMLDAIDARVQFLLQSEQHDRPESAALIERERVLAVTLAGENSRESIRALLREARWRFQRGDYPAFRPLIAAAAARAGRVPTGDAADRAEIELLGALADYRILDRQREGVTRAARALDALRAAQPPRTRAVFDALCVYGRMKRDSQETADAVRLLGECERHARTLFGTDSSARAEALSMLGYALRESGEYAKGIDALDDAVRIAAARQPYNQALHVRTLMALGTNLEILGDLERAGTTLQTAMSLEDKQPTLNPFERATLLSNIGTHYYYRGDLERALAYDARALPIFERVLGSASATVRMARINHAALLQESGKLDAAADIYVREIAAYEKNPAAMPGDGALLPFANLAEVRLRQRRYAQSATLYQRFLQELGAGRDLTESTPSGALAGLAAVRWAQKQYAAAFAYARRAQASSMRVRRAALDGLSERQLLALDNTNRDYATLATAIAADSGDAGLVEQAWQLVLDADGAVTHAASMRLADANANRAGAGADFWREWRAANGTLSAARVAAVRTPSAASIAAVDRAQERVDRSERHIAERDVQAHAALAAQFGSLETLRAALPPGSALLRFVEIDVPHPDAYRNDRRGDDAELFALVAEHGRRARVVPLGRTRDIADRVDRWYALASRGDADPALADTAAKSLHAAVLAPVSLAAPIARVYVVPSAALQRVNFAALVGGDGRYLVESERMFHLLNHERELLTPAPTATPALLLAGAPGATDAGNDATARLRSTCAQIADGRFASLPGASSEIAALSELADGHAGRVDVLTGMKATEAAVRDAMPGHSIVHLATHAFAFGDHCAEGETVRSIALDASPPPDKTAAGEDLASLSALAFLSQPQDGEAYDGLLTSEEIATLNLSSADWVVLSACETALGRVQAGEGVFGLRRAFRLAGARTVVMSVWKVEDRATAQFMQALYTARLVERADTPAAMQAAMRSTLAARRARGESTHPLYWAGFVAAGAWR